jgi:exopolysaccharide biosynthesis polyprenyl glycosylphosphotransferase
MRTTGVAPRGPCFHLTHLALDLAALSAAWRITAELRLLLNAYMTAAIPRGVIDDVAPRPLTLLALWVLASAWLKTYRDRSDRSLVVELFRVVKSTLVFCTLAILFTFFFRHFGADLSRSFVLILAPVTFLCLVASLVLAIPVARRLGRRWPTLKRVAVLGAAEEAGEVIAALRHAGSEEIAFRGLILPEQAAQAVCAAAAPDSSVELPVLGTTRQLAELINRESLDRIIVASNLLSEPEFELCGSVTRRMGVTVSRPLRRTGTGVIVTCQREYGLHLIDVEAHPFSHWQEALKRGIDAAASLAAITILLPVFAVLGCLVRLTSEGPVFYKSQRVGKGGRHFAFWKFRSMYTHGPHRRELAERNENSGHLFKIRRDPRITPLGRLMRRLSLDELPQLFNVLAGEMSLVGPRPLPAEDLDQDGMSGSFAMWAEQRALVRPGITGLWQINGRSDLPFEQMVKMDLEYVRRRSLVFDLRILLQTPWAVLSGRGAY